ncbi:MAG: ABC transporter ATP-binding protein [Rubrobacteraceae bacterium]
MPSVSLKDISKRYKIYPRAQDRLKEILSFGRVNYGHEFWALKNIDLSVEPGSIVGILGRNGAGKSTLLKIISGVLQPTGGEVEVDGRLSALLQLGAGFNGEFTGRENVFLNGLILGIDRQEMIERFDEIAAFADLGEFMNQPVKTYSSGMRARLGFAVAVNVEPDILIVDETLSVGDAVFKQMGLQKMRDLMNSGATILFVSHSLEMVKNLCTEAVLLHKGELVAAGGTSETLDRYQALLSRLQAQKRGQLLDQAPEYNIEEEDEELTTPAFKKDPDLERRHATLRHGTGRARVSSVEILDEQHRPVELVEAGSIITVRVHVQYLGEVKRSAVSITLRNKAGLDIFSTGTGAESTPIKKRSQDERVIVDFTFQVPLQHGIYSVAAAISEKQSRNLYLDWVDVATVFKIGRPKTRQAFAGLVHLPTQVEIYSPDQTQQSRSA